MELHVLLWSQSQNALHRERLRDMLQENWQAFHENRRMDYVPLCVGTQEECEAAAEQVRPEVHRRDDERQRL